MVHWQWASWDRPVAGGGFDCFAGYNSPEEQRSWSVSKLEWCCSYMGMGCYTEGNTTSTTTTILQTFIDAFGVGFPGGPKQGVQHFSWSKIAATGGLRVLCWCTDSLPSFSCDHWGSFVHQVGTIMIVGPDAGHAFECYASEQCSIAPVVGKELSNGFKLMYRSRGHCGSSLAISDPKYLRPQVQDKVVLSAAYKNFPGAESGPLDPGDIGFQMMDDVENQKYYVRKDAYKWWYDEGAIELLSDNLIVEVSHPAINCEAYFIGCTSSWDPSQMQIPAGDYRLCWASEAAWKDCEANDCDPRTTFVVDIGWLKVTTV